MCIFLHFMKAVYHRISVKAIPEFPQADIRNNIISKSGFLPAVSDNGRSAKGPDKKVQ